MGLAGASTPDINNRPHVQGRREVFTPEVQEILIEALSRGLSKKDACAIAGISYPALRKWQQMAYPEHPNFDQKYLDFMLLVKKAEIALKEKCLKTIISAVETGDANIALKVLERKWRKEWSTQANLTLAGDPENPIITKVIAFDPSAFPTPAQATKVEEDDDEE